MPKHIRVDRYREHIDKMYEPAPIAEINNADQAVVEITDVEEVPEVKPTARPKRKKKPVVESPPVSDPMEEILKEDSNVTSDETPSSEGDL